MTFGRNEVFTGREEDLLAIAKALVYGEESGLGIVQAAGGMGGIGKTELAVEFCYRYGRFFEGVHWIQARAETRGEAGEAEIAAEVAACGARMGLAPWPQDTPEQVERTLLEWGRGGRRLAVLDNLEDPELLGKWRPRLGGLRVLVTSRRTDWPKGMGVETYPLGLLKREESLELLRKLAPRLREVSDEPLGEIGKQLGDLPLALELAGRYLDERPGLGVEGFLKELEEKGALEHTALKDWVQKGHTRHEADLAATFLVSWRELEGEAGRTARRIFYTAGYCAANAPIPREVLAKAVGEEEGEAGQAFDRGLRRLSELGLLGRGEEGATVHPLLGEFGRLMGADEAKETLEGLAEALADLMYDANESGLPAKGKGLRPHLEAAALEVEAAGLVEAGRLWNSLGYHLDMTAEYKVARGYYEHALRIVEQIHGTEHPNVATLANNLGSVLKELGDLEGAKEHYERALRIDEKVYGPEHPKVATFVNNLGSVLQDLGNLEGARQQIERALRILEKFLPEGHPRIGDARRNLKAVIRMMNDSP
jgi:tetratricopeptide (TPR) repeat protein